MLTPQNNSDSYGGGGGSRSSSSRSNTAVSGISVQNCEERQRNHPAAVADLGWLIFSAALGSGAAPLKSTDEERHSTQQHMEHMECSSGAEPDLADSLDLLASDIEQPQDALLRLAKPGTVVDEFRLKWLAEPFESREMVLTSLCNTLRAPETVDSEPSLVAAWTNALPFLERASAVDWMAKDILIRNGALRLALKALPKIRSAGVAATMDGNLTANIVRFVRTSVQELLSFTESRSAWEAQRELLDPSTLRLWADILREELDLTFLTEVCELLSAVLTHSPCTFTSANQGMCLFAQLLDLELIQVQTRVVELAVREVEDLAASTQVTSNAVSRQLRLLEAAITVLNLLTCPRLIYADRPALTVPLANALEEQAAPDSNETYRVTNMKALCRAMKLLQQGPVGGLEVPEAQAVTLWTLAVETLSNLCTEPDKVVANKGTLVKDKYSRSLLDDLIGMLRSLMEGVGAFAAFSAATRRRVAYFAASLLVEYLRNAMLLIGGPERPLPIERQPQPIPNRPFPQLSYLLSNPQFADYTIEVGDGVQHQSRTFFAHRCVLAAYVEYFQRSFAQCLNGDVDFVQFPEVDPVLFEKWLHHVYTFDSSVIDSVNVASGLLVLADRFCQQHLLRDCETFLFEHMSELNVDAMLDLALAHHATALKEAAAMFALKLLPDRFKDNTIGVWWLRGHSMIASSQTGNGAKSPMQEADGNCLRREAFMDPELRHLRLILDRAEELTALGFARDDG